jgi:hypothetical protein
MHTDIVVSHGQCLEDNTLHTIKLQSAGVLFETTGKEWEDVLQWLFLMLFGIPWCFIS